MSVKSDRWFTAIVKSAFKDESAISNISLEKHSSDNNIQRMERPLTNIDDESSFHSYDPHSKDRYEPDLSCQGMNGDEISDIIDLSNIQSDTQGAIDISFSQDETMKELLSPNSGGVSFSVSDEKVLESIGSSTTDEDSSLLNIWNEDYDGTPDPAIFKKLMEAKRLPKNLDPYIVAHIRRAKIAEQLDELERMDDDSSNGSCNALCTHFFMPGRIQDDDDISSCNDHDSIVDTVINFDSTDTDDKDVIDDKDSCNGLEDSSCESKEPSLHAIREDKSDFHLMTPEVRNKATKNLPVQYTMKTLDGDSSLVKQNKAAQEISAKVGKETSTGNVVFTETDPKDDLEKIALEKLRFREKGLSPDDDPIEEDRSILSQPEIDELQSELEEPCLRVIKVVEPALQESKVENKPHSPKKKQDPLSQIIDIFNNKQSCAIQITSTNDDELLNEAACSSLNLGITKEVFAEDVEVTPSIENTLTNATDEEHLNSSQCAFTFPNHNHDIVVKESCGAVSNCIDESEIEKSCDVTHKHLDQNEEFSLEESFDETDNIYGKKDDDADLSYDEHDDCDNDDLISYASSPRATARPREWMHITKSISTETALTNDDLLSTTSFTHQTINSETKSKIGKEANIDKKEMLDCGFCHSRLQIASSDSCENTRMQIIASASSDSMRLNPVDDLLIPSTCSKEANKPTAHNHIDDEAHDILLPLESLLSSESLVMNPIDEKSETIDEEVDSNQFLSFDNEESDHTEKESMELIAEVIRNITTNSEDSTDTTVNTQPFSSIENTMQEEKVVTKKEIKDTSKNISNTESFGAITAASTYSESAEVVMGVTVEGVTFNCPSGEYGFIIEPEHYDDLMRAQVND